MRIYQNPFEAMRETERELFEMGIEVHPETMQDKVVKDDPDYNTLEIRGYAFKVIDWALEMELFTRILDYFYRDKVHDIMAYILTEFRERTSGQSSNPGRSYLSRKDVWDEFLHDGKFAYTYSERIAPQLMAVLEELKKNPETRQGIINLHSNICPTQAELVDPSYDLRNIGGAGRIPCSLYYQLMIREGKLDLIYGMRSCDFLVHFPVDICLALLTQDWFADKLNLKTGAFTWFCGSLHAYHKDLKKRGIF